MTATQPPLLVPIASTHRHAEALLDSLVDHGRGTSEELCRRLGWPKGRFTGALRYAREHLCPSLGISIPHPTPDTGWTYEATTEWEPVEAGASYALGLQETRLRGILRDVKTIRPLVPRGSQAWRRASFLEKHLQHLTDTMSEINGSPAP